MLFNKNVAGTELATFMANQSATEEVLEACYSSHHWARCFEAMGHAVNLLAPQHVAPFVCGNKSGEYGIVAMLGHKVFCMFLCDAGQPCSRLLSPLINTQIHKIADEYYGLTARIGEITDTLETTVAIRSEAAASPSVAISICANN